MRRHIIAIIAGLAAAWAACGCASAQSAVAPNPTKRVALSYQSNGHEVPALMIAPVKKGRYPVVLFLHGRFGLTEPLAAYLETIAERGVVILAPDYHFARAVPSLAPFHDPDMLPDVEAAVPFLASIKGQYTTLTEARLGIVAQDHGAYFGVLLSTGMADKFGALIGIYPLLQDPNVNKIQHLYAFTRAIEELNVPTLLLIGRNDREMRRIQVERVAARLEALKRDVRLVVYQGAQRCFDWRTSDANLSNTIARADATNQIVRQLKTTIGGDKLLVIGAHGWEFL
jgi:dienelactone hydrolase